MIGGYRAILVVKNALNMKEEVKQYMLRKKKKKRKVQINLMADFDDMAFDEEEEEKVAEIDARGKWVQNVGGSGISKEKSRHVGPMDAFVTHLPKTTQWERVERGSKQQLMFLTIKS